MVPSWAPETLASSQLISEYPHGSPEDAERPRLAPGPAAHSLIRTRELWVIAAAFPEMRGQSVPRPSLLLAVMQMDGFSCLPQGHRDFSQMQSHLLIPDQPKTPSSRLPLPLLPPSSPSPSSSPFVPPFVTSASDFLLPVHLSSLHPTLSLHPSPNTPKALQRSRPWPGASLENYLPLRELAQAPPRPVPPSTESWVAFCSLSQQCTWSHLLLDSHSFIGTCTHSMRMF